MNEDTEKSFKDLFQLYFSKKTEEKEKRIEEMIAKLEERIQKLEDKLNKGFRIVVKLDEAEEDEKEEED